MRNDRTSIPAIDATAGLFEENIFARIANDYEYFPASWSPWVSLMKVFGLCSFSLTRLGINLGM